MLTKIITGLWLGDHDDSLDGPLLKKAGITTILNVAQGITHKKQYEGIKYVKIGLVDDSINDYRVIALILKVMNSLINHGEKVLIHCALGISRSPFIVAMYLAKNMDQDINNAYKLLKEKYPHADEETPLKFTKGLKKIYDE